jgi:hypothetical protein
MARDTKFRLEEIKTDTKKNTKCAPISEIDQGVVAWMADKVIFLAQINGAGLQTEGPATMTLETVDTEKMEGYLKDLLANGWTIHENIAESVADMWPNL